MHYKETEYGFEYGAAEILRCFGDEKKGWVVIEVRTPKYPLGIQIYVTKTGKVVFTDSDGKGFVKQKLDIH